MISVLAQERLLGAALGGALASALVFENRRRIYATISENYAKFDHRPHMLKPIIEKKSNFDIAHLWNKTVDKAFSRAIDSVSSRGW